MAVPLTDWQVQHNGQIWGAGGADGVQPSALAYYMQQHAGESRVTYFGKPYTIDPADPQSVFDYFDSEIDRSGERTVLRWEYTPSPGEFDGDAVP